MKCNSSISVVLITCNRPLNILERSLNSVLFQTYRNIWVIIVDTNIDSEISKKIANYVGSLCRSNIELIKMPGGSSNQARNAGFNMTNSEYVAFLDDDDEWALDKLEKQLEFFKEGISLVYSNYYVADKNDFKLFIDAPYEGNLKTIILGENVIGCTSMPLLLTQAYIDVGGFDQSFKANQDWDLWIRILQNHKVAYSPTIAGTKHYSDNSISNSRYRRASGWFSLFIKHAGKYMKNREQLVVALGFFSREMLHKKVYIVGAPAFILYLLIEKINFKR
ncbi:MAG: hypothetical protein PWR17_1202 [Candidatus Methanomethylophilaceae archaeon]|nr:hypothetical protein [Candidatus Methanomethylophilaceae archaeon]